GVEHAGPPEHRPHLELPLEFLKDRQAVKEAAERIRIAGPRRGFRVELGDAEQLIGGEEGIEAASRVRVAVAGLDGEQRFFPVAEAKLAAKYRIGESPVEDHLQG